MTTWIALLRGINVGKAKRVAMADLRACAEGLGHTDVRTLLNSGNLVFCSASKSPRTITAKLEQAIVRDLGVTSRVTLLSQGDLERVARENTLAKKATDPSRLFVTVLTDPADRAKLAGVARQAWTPEAFALGSRAAYLW